jgi:hypothetical protein
MPFGFLKKGKADRERIRQYNQAVKIWQQERDERIRKYEYDVESLKIIQDNNEKNLQYQEKVADQRYQYGKAVQDYEFKTATRAFNESLRRAGDQLSNNQLAYDQANLQQTRYTVENMIKLDYEEDQAAMEYMFAGAGINLKKTQARRQAAVAADTEEIAAQKAAGEARARGQAGVSSYKAIQGLLAESGARQAAIVDNLMSAQAGLDMDLAQISGQLLMDKAQLAASKGSLLASDAANRVEFIQQKLQADLNTEASILLRPEMAPPLPEPFKLPRPEYAEVFRPNFEAKIGRPTKEQFGQKYSWGEVIAGDALKIGLAVGAGALAAGGSGLATGAGTSGIGSLGAADAAGYSAGFSTLMGGGSFTY